MGNRDELSSCSIGIIRVWGRLRWWCPRERKRKWMYFFGPFLSLSLNIMQAVKCYRVWLVCLPKSFGLWFFFTFPLLLLLSAASAVASSAASYLQDAQVCDDHAAGIFTFFFWRKKNPKSIFLSVYAEEQWSVEVGGKEEDSVLFNADLFSCTTRQRACER